MADIAAEKFRCDTSLTSSPIFERREFEPTKVHLVNIKDEKDCMDTDIELSLKQRLQASLSELKSTIMKPWFKENADIPVYRVASVANHINVAGNLNAVRTLRKIVPQLAAYRGVNFDLVNNFWLVFEGTSKLPRAVELPLFIGQCPVYIHEQKGITPNPYQIGHHQLDAIVDPRHIVSDRSCGTIKRGFPYSIGMRVHAYGFIEILYESDQHIRYDLLRRLPAGICGLNYNMKVVDIDFMAGNVCINGNICINVPNHARFKERFATPSEIIGADSPRAFQQGFHPFYRCCLGDLYREDQPGPVVFEQAVDAVITGTDYWWDQAHAKVEKAIIWRIIADQQPIQEGSGVIMYLGHPTAATRTAAVFQNYESRTMVKRPFWKKRWWHSSRLERFQKRASYNGGFFRQNNVQTSTDVDVIRRQLSGPATDSFS